MTEIESDAGEGVTEDRDRECLGKRANLHCSHDMTGVYTPEKMTDSETSAQST